ncbi:hypothetical protein SAY87_027769 [Trapa incisa]|uniref:Pectinesterase inhibitor domain-containing protein n=2 Tax=Trapa TaxID=22665 RepID=A0AAN7M880_TRANT|nr:hypothetical protein SAY87_027769 [Trapa incisa]KAK4800036.1 hypothetical protein SAY86_025401 [Trapa natans]
MQSLTPSAPLLLLILSFLLLLHSTAAAEESNATTEYIRSSCASTLYPDVCYSSLSRYAGAVQNDPNRLARVAISVSLLRARVMAAYLSNMTEQAENWPEPLAVAALHDCVSNFDSAVDQIRGSLEQMRGLDSSSQESFRFQMSNVQTWMSAALTDQETCTDGFDEVGDCPLKSDVNERSTHVKQVTSNALALVNSFVNQTAP